MPSAGKFSLHQPAQSAPTGKAEGVGQLAQPATLSSGPAQCKQHVHCVEITINKLWVSL